MICYIMYLIIDISDFLLKYATMLNLIDPLFSKMEIYAAKKNWTRILTLC